MSVRANTGNRRHRCLCLWVPRPLDSSPDEMGIITICQGGFGPEADRRIDRRACPFGARDENGRRVDLHAGASTPVLLSVSLRFPPKDSAWSQNCESIEKFV